MLPCREKCEEGVRGRTPLETSLGVLVGNPVDARPGSGRDRAQVGRFDMPQGAIGRIGRCSLRRRTPHEWRPSSTTEIEKRDSRLVASGTIA